MATDHQPLIGVFNKPLEKITSERLARIREKTMLFSFKVVYTPAKQNQGTDAVSRSPVDSIDCNLIETPSIEEDMNQMPYNVIACLSVEDNCSDIDYTIHYSKLLESIRTDASYQQLQQLIKEGFPSDKHSVEEQFQRLWDVKDQLTITESGVILVGYRIYIPKNYRKTILRLLHAAHQGVTTMKRRANESVFWPGINNDLRNTRLNCQYCNEIAPRYTKEPLMITPDPSFPFQHIARDFFAVKGHTYLVLVDRYSGWFNVSYFKPNQATSANVIRECIGLFSAYGTPEVFASDGGPQFTSNEFKIFLKDWDVIHRVSSPLYPQSNRRAEAAVKTAKRIISNYVTKEEPYNHRAIAEAIMQHRNTPLTDLKLSPAQILFHRKLRDRVPTHPKHLRLHKKWILTAKQREHLYSATKAASMERYNRISQTLVSLKPRTKVMVLTNLKNPRWSLSGTVVMQLPFRSYRVKMHGSGRTIIRNRRFLRPYQDGHDHSYADTTIDTSITPSTMLPPTENTQLQSNASTDSHSSDIPENRIVKELQDFNNPGTRESNDTYSYRTTRSGQKY